MARTPTQQVRVRAYDLTRALRAAAAFTDANKKSHRHRICLRTSSWLQDVDGKPTNKAALIAGAGGPLRVINVMAGDLKEFDFFRVDITPGAAALIVKLFSQAGEVELKSDGKTLAVTSTDQLFDNRRIEVRALKPEDRSDSVVIAQRLSTIWEESPTHLSVSHEASVAIAAAAKALGSNADTNGCLIGGQAGVEILFGHAAVGYSRAYPAASYSAAWESTLRVNLDPAWDDEHVHLQHYLDGALPRRSVTIVPPTYETVEDAGSIDLDNLDETHTVDVVTTVDAFADEEAIA